jgi:hypothetical protein
LIYPLELVLRDIKWKKCFPNKHASIISTFHF